MNRMNEDNPHPQKKSRLAAVLHANEGDDIDDMVDDERRLSIEKALHDSRAEFNQTILLYYPSVFNQYVAHAKGEQAMQNSLKGLLERSREHPESATAAANAISILNFVGISFAGQDLSGISIPNASLAGANLCGTDLSGSDLTGVDFRGAFLRSTCFDGAVMSRVIFGKQLPLVGHRNGMRALAVSIDGRWIATGGCDFTARVWDYQTGECISVLHHNSIVSEVAFSPDGLTLVTCGPNGLVLHWDIGSARVLHQYKGHQGRVWCVAYSRSGEYLASVGEDKIVRLWHPFNDAYALLKGHSKRVMGVVFSHDSELVASTSSDCTARIWSVRRRECLITIELGELAHGSTIDFSRTGNEIATGDSEGQLRLWDTATGRLIRQFVGHEHWVMKLAFSSDGRTLASGANDRSIRLWDIETGQCLQHYTLHNTWFDTLVFHPNSQWVISCLADHKVHFFYVDAHNRPIREGDRRHVDAFAISPTGIWCALVKELSLVEVVETQSGRLVHRFENLEDVNAVAIAPDSETLAFNEQDVITLYSTENWQQLNTYEEHDQYVTALTFSSDGHTLFSGDDDGCVKQWELPGSRCVRTVQTDPHHLEVIQIIASMNGQYLVTVLLDGYAKVWPLRDSELQPVHYPLEGDHSTCVAIHSDGALIASTISDEGEMCLYDSANGRILGERLEHHYRQVNCVHFSHDGHYLAAGSRDNAISIWRTEDRSYLISLNGHAKTVTHVLWNPKTYELYSIDCTGLLYAWNLNAFFEEGKQPTLQWRSGGELYIESPSIRNVVDLSEKNRALLKHYGAFSEPQANEPANNPIDLEPRAAGVHP